MIICAAIGILVFTGLNSCAVYYYTVSELVEEGKVEYGESIRVSGKVIGSSIKWDTSKPELRFDITDESSSLSVIYEGELPHTFEEDKNIIIKGKYSPDGTFHATKLTMKCASKYTPED